VEEAGVSRQVPCGDLVLSLEMEVGLLVRKVAVVVVEVKPGIITWISTAFQGLAVFIVVKMVMQEKGMVKVLQCRKIYGTLWIWKDVT
jgi:Flp pilus assembly pilin Flp